MKKNTASACMCYCILRLTLFIIALVTIFVTVLLLPPAIQICVALMSALFVGLFCLATDRSIAQKKE